MKLKLDMLDIKDVQFAEKTMVDKRSAFYQSP